MGLEFSLRHGTTGVEVPLYRDLLNLRVSGFSRARHSYRRSRGLGVVTGEYRIPLSLSFDAGMFVISLVVSGQSPIAAFTRRFINS